MDQGLYSTTKVEVVREYFSDATELNKVDKFGLVPLHWFSIRNSSPEILISLLELGARVEEQSANGLTPLHGAAAYNANPEIISTLIAANAEVNTLSASGLSPLHGAAAYNANPDVLAELFKSGALIDQNSPAEITPLHAAASFSSNPKIIQILVSNGAKVNCSDEKGNTPLHVASSINDKPAITKALLAADAEVNAQNSEGLTPLHLAARDKTSPEVLKTLITYGAKVGIADKQGNLPYDLARTSNAKIAGARIFKKLRTLHRENWGTREFFQEATVEDVARCLEQGAKVAGQNLPNGLTPLHWAARCTIHKEVIEILIKNGADINVPERTGLTPLHWAVQNPNIPVQIVDLMVQKGGDIHVRTRNTKATLIETAIRHATNGEVLTHLIKLGCPVENDLVKGTPLIHRAVTNTHCPIELLEELVEHGIDPTVLDRQKNTPLHSSLKTNKINLPLIKKLISMGIDPNTQNSLGNTALHRMVRMSSSLSAIEFLIDAGADPYLTNFKGKSPYELASGSLKNHIAKAVQGNIEPEQAKIAAEQQDSADTSSA